ncbi:ABC transporter ATP-binding protein, partial [Salmonella enterica subsp. arizonae]|nr:ABC transporter ATP-binding protein [Salmonella enterica subsp. arizonae]
KINVSTDKKTGRRSDPFYAVLRITAVLSLWRSRCPP